MFSSRDPKPETLVFQMLDGLKLSGAPGAPGAVAAPRVAERAPSSDTDFARLQTGLT